MRFAPVFSLAFLAVAVAACTANAEGAGASTAALGDSPGAAAAAARLDALKGGGDQAGLEAFLRGMPKGGDLHNHLSGAVYAESFIGWAHHDGLCVNPQTMTAVPAAQCGTVDPVTSATPVPLPVAPTDPLFSKLVAAWSMEGFDPAAGQSGHDHFFATFGKFGLVSSTHTGDMIAEAQTRAAAENESYLELMLSLSAGGASKIGDRVWGTGHGEPQSDADFETLYDGLLAASDWTSTIATATTYLDADEAASKADLGCGGTSPAAGCGVTVRYLYQTTRSGPPHQVFAQFVAAFETALVEKRIVGMNLVAAEDGTVALRDYDLHMSMLDFLHRKYAGRSPLRIALHAGELSPSVLPAGDSHDLTFHVRHAVEIGHAERIGHGVDVLSEDDSAALRAELHGANVLVEMCLSSNADILQVSGTNHPLSAYLGSGVPLTIATDDPGVARSNMTVEYVRAATDQNLGYDALKTMARNSIEHSFLPGGSLFSSFTDTTPAAACAGDLLGSDAPSAGCKDFLGSSERATMQWDPERRFVAFEAAQR
jgi:hypothetical protein